MHTLSPDRPALMGILNVTPDSFSDGGSYFRPDEAIAHAIQMMQDGADLIDVGGESTRPGADPVSLDEELRRVLPVIQTLIAKGIPVSCDTSKPDVAFEALKLGAQVINDVTGFRDKAMIGAVAEFDCNVCVMHMQGEPRTMQANPTYEDVVAEVSAHLSVRASELEQRGIAKERIWVDPGIGFGKSAAHNLALLNHLDKLSAQPILIGVSRKSFIGRLLGTADAPLAANQRLEGTLAAQTIAQVRGARIIRAHDIAESRKAIEMTAAILAG